MTSGAVTAFWRDKLPVPISELREGASCVDHIRLYDAILATTGPLKHILEIGLNGGHSASMWLLKTNSTTKLTDVDIGHHPYIQDVVNVLKQEFPNRFDCIIKSSLEVYPDICNNKYDLIYVDGDHTYDGAYADLLMAEKLAPSYIMVDDTDPPCDPGTTHIPKNIYVPHALAEFLKRNTYEPVMLWNGPAYPQKDGLPVLPRPKNNNIYPARVGWGGYLLKKI